MKTKFMIILLCSILCELHSIQTLQAQTVLKGMAYELSSGNKPIPGVEIIAEHSTVGNSDNDGRFFIAFQEKRGGEPVCVARIYKKGYELVNSEDVQNWTFSPSKIFKVILCKEGFLAEAKRMYYKIGEDHYKEEYRKISKELNELRQQNNISEEEFEVALTKANEELLRKRKELNYYADKFSRINKDELTDIDEQALNLLEQAKIEEAIRIYEDAKILENFLMKVQVRDTANYNIASVTPLLFKEVELILQKGSGENRLLADTILRTIAKSDTLNFEYSFKYGSFLLHGDQIDDACFWYRNALKNAATQEQKSRIKVALEELYPRLPDKEQVLKLRNEADAIH